MRRGEEKKENATKFRLDRGDNGKGEGILVFSRVFFLLSIVNCNYQLTNGKRNVGITV